MALNIRSVLESLCAILHDNDVATGLKAEVFRQAKFDEERATEQMWKALFDSIMFYDKKSSLKCSSPMDSSKAEIVHFVKSRLQNWGYLSKSFAELPSDMTRGSRELLLALGWLIHSKDIMGKIVSRRSSPLQQKFKDFVSSPDLSSMLPLPVKTSSRSLSAKQQLQRQLMLCGKLKLSLRRLHASLQQSAKLKQEIHIHTRGHNLDPEMDHLTPVEVYLLRYPNRMKEMYQELTQDNAQLKNLLEWKGKEQVFWEWMDSVLTLHMQEGNNSHEEEIKPATTESIFLSVPSTIAEDITNVRTELREFILQHEEEMHHLDKTLANKKVSYEELQIATHRSERELAELTQKFSESTFDEHDSPRSPGPPLLVSKPFSSEANMTTAYSSQSMKRNKKAEILEMIKEELENLQEKVAKLESELKETQLNNVHKFQTIFAQNDSLICILPRYFKEFAST